MTIGVKSNKFFPIICTNAIPLVYVNNPNTIEIQYSLHPQNLFSYIYCQKYRKLKKYER